MRLTWIVSLLLALGANATARPHFPSSLPATPTSLHAPEEALKPAAAPLGAAALAEVNATRAARGLPPFIHDEGLAQAALTCAELRAQYLLAGHTANDFAALPAGSTARAAGCGALEPSWGWGTCCTYENYQYAGAAVVMGRDGRRYMHLFVR